MRAVVQRCLKCSVVSEGVPAGSIQKGLLVFLGVERGDTRKDADYIVDKIIHMRILEDETGKMNLSILDRHEELMIVSQFTLLGDVRKGRRPSFTQSENPEKANELYEYVIRQCQSSGITTASGRFQTDMKVSLVNDGPVTILLDSRKLF